MDNALNKSLTHRMHWVRQTFHRTLITSPSAREQAQLILISLQQYFKGALLWTPFFMMNLIMQTTTPLNF